MPLKIIPHITNRQIIIIAVSGIALIILAFIIFHKKDKPVHPLSSNDIIKASIDSAIAPLKVRNDSLLREVDSLQRLINGTSQRNIDLQSQIAKEHNARFTLKKLYDEKISSVDKFTPADIDSFITDRYLNKQRRK